MDEHILKRVTLTLKCRHCGGLYGSGDIQVLGQHKEKWFLSVHCPHCQNESLVTVSVKKADSSQPTTELHAHKRKSVSKLPPISSDDLLDLHLFLRDFDGDLSSTLTGQ